MKLSIIGGDLRMIKLAELLKEDSYEVLTYGMKEKSKKVKNSETLEETIMFSDVIISSIPFSKDGEYVNGNFNEEKLEIEKFLNKITEKTLITGPVSDKIQKLAEINNVKIIDIMARDELIIMNAITTAEGTIQVIMEKTNITVDKSKILILGFGRIGKILAYKLKALGAEVFCEARKVSDYAWIKAYDYNVVPLKELKSCLGKFQIIVNTIPSMMLDREELELVNKEVFLIDIASNPGGINREIAENKKINYVWELGIPGKVAPNTAAEHIKETLYNIFDEN